MIKRRNLQYDHYVPSLIGFNFLRLLLLTILTTKTGMIKRINLKYEQILFKSRLLKYQVNNGWASVPYHAIFSVRDWIFLEMGHLNLWPERKMCYWKVIVLGLSFWTLFVNLWESNFNAKNFFEFKNLYLYLNFYYRYENAKLIFSRKKHFWI